MKNLSDKVAIVTGCTGGIGSEVCKSLASNEVKVIGISRNFNENVDGYLHEYISADLGRFDSINNISTILQKYNHIDLLINCSGSLIPGNLDSLSNYEIESNINSNLFAVINSIKMVLPIMKKQMNGQIIIPMPFEAIAEVLLKLIIATFIYFKLSIFQRHHAQKRVFTNLKSKENKFLNTA